MGVQHRGSAGESRYLARWHREEVKKDLRNKRKGKGKGSVPGNFSYSSVKLLASS